MNAERWMGLAVAAMVACTWTVDAQVAKPWRGGAGLLPGAWATTGARERLKVRRVAELDAMRVPWRRGLRSLAFASY